MTDNFLTFFLHTTYFFGLATYRALYYIALDSHYNVHILYNIDSRNNAVPHCILLQCVAEYDFSL